MVVISQSIKCTSEEGDVAINQKRKKTATMNHKCIAFVIWQEISSANVNMKQGLSKKTHLFNQNMCQELT